MVDMDLVLAWYETLNPKPFRIDFDTRSAQSNIEQIPLGWNDDSDEEERIDTTCSEFTELPSTTVDIAMEPLYAAHSSVREDNNNQNQPHQSLVPCRKGRLTEWLKSVKARKSLVPQRPKKENDAEDEDETGEIESIMTDLDNTSIGFASIATYASKLGTSSALTPRQKVPSSCAGRGGYNTGRGGSTWTPLRSLTAATAVLNERLLEARLLGERNGKSSSSIVTSPAIQSYMNE